MPFHFKENRLIPLIPLGTYVLEYLQYKSSDMLKIVLILENDVLASPHQAPKKLTRAGAMDSCHPRSCPSVWYVASGRHTILVHHNKPLRFTYQYQFYIVSITWNYSFESMAIKYRVGIHLELWLESKSNESSAICWVSTERHEILQGYVSKLFQHQMVATCILRRLWRKG